MVQHAFIIVVHEVPIVPIVPIAIGIGIGIVYFVKGFVDFVTRKR